MGIRYYAYALQPDDVAAARRDPYPFMSDDPFMDAWGQPECPDSLYLDKAWRELQHVFTGHGGNNCPRVALELVTGKVTPVGNGQHRGFVQVLPPEVVESIAKDIALVEPVDDATIKEAFPNSDADYVNEFLGRAQRFTTGLARQGLGLVYAIQ